jgi:hypothetical protein
VYFKIQLAAIVTKAAMTTGVGMLSISPAPKKTIPGTKPLIMRPCMSRYTKPRAISRMPKVTRKPGSLM